MFRLGFFYPYKWQSIKRDWDIRYQTFLISSTHCWEDLNSPSVQPFLRTPHFNWHFIRLWICLNFPLQPVFGLQFSWTIFAFVKVRHIGITSFRFVYLVIRDGNLAWIKCPIVFGVKHFEMFLSLLLVSHLITFILLIG